MSPEDEARLDRRLDRQDNILVEIHTQVKATNGRVTKLELDSAVDKALRAQVESQKERKQSRQAWTMPAVCMVGATLGATVLAHFLAHL